jgi:serine/threonine protein kinase/tetratricopeptide (TPR) repeat protein
LEYGESVAASRINQKNLNFIAASESVSDKQSKNCRMRRLSDLHTFNENVKRENWEQVKDIFNRALGIAPRERAEFLTDACAGDEGLRRDVEILLASYDETENFLENPAVGEFAELIADEQNELKVGEIVAHYEILALLGAGGMGEVYLAQDTKLNRRVALKFLPADASNSNSRKRFVREAQAAAALDHPHICAIYEIAETDSRTFIAMQYVKGETLADKLKRENLSVSESVEIAAQIADALAEAHSRGIIHRDIKPANVIVNSRGSVKVLDFGLAKIVSGETGANSSLSNAGLIMGTAAYMSPEQARGLPVDGRTDVWSLGVVLYEMLAGKLPFAGETTSDRIAAILKSEPPPLADFAAAPEELQIIVSKSLSKNLADRYASAGEMLTDLRRVRKQIESVFEHTTIRDLKVGDAASGKDTDEILPKTNRENLQPQTAESKIGRHWLAPALAFATLVLGIIGYQFYAGKSALPTNFKQTTTAENKTNLMRRAVALVGFKDLANRAETAWLSHALSEMLSTELAAGEKLRVVPQENVARMKSEISMSDADNLTPEILQKIWANLNAELIVSGSYVVLNETAGEQIRLDVRVLNATTGETAASIAESGKKAELFDLVSRVGARLREALGAGFLNDADKNSLRASQPANPKAAELYAEGREKLNSFDFLSARDLLERAIVADAKFPLSHLSLAAALQKLGEDAKAKESAQKAFELSGSLRREERLAVEAFYRDIAGERDKAIEIYKTLFDFFPDNLEYGLHLAGTQSKAGKSNDALATIESLRKLPAPVSEDPRIDIAEGDAADALSDYNRELAVARTAAEKGLNRNASLLVAEARYYEGWALWNLGDNAASLAAYDEARRIYNEAGRRKSVADILNAVATLHYRQGELDKALRIFEECLVIDREIGSKGGAAAVLNNIANIYKDRDELANARRYYEDSLALEKEIGIKTRICVVLFNLAGVIKMQGDLSESKEMYEQALALARETGRKTTITMALQELAEIFYYKNELATARKSAEESLSVAREIKRRTSEAYTLMTLGRIALAENDIKAAHEHLEQSLQIRRELGEETAIAESQMFLAQLALAENRPADAVSLAQPAAEVFAKKQAVSSEAEARANLALAHLGTGGIEAAQTEISYAANLANTGENKLSRLYVRIAEARVLTATNRQAEAKRILRGVVSESNKLGFLNFALEARK